MPSSQYAFAGAGTFSATQGFKSIDFLDATAAIFYDTTGALELLVDVAIFNNYIGITKDENYINLTNATTSSNFYDSNNDVLNTSALTLTSTDVFDELSNNLSSIENVGKLSTLYSDFDDYVSSYFGLPTISTSTTTSGFATLYDGVYDFDPYGGVFGPEQLLNILTSNITNQETLGASISGISGSVSLNNITEILRSAVSKNSFKNRNTYYGSTASSSTDRANYGVTDGFMDGDLLFIPSDGFQVTLDLAIATTNISNINGVTQGLETQVAQDAAGSLPLKNFYDTNGEIISTNFKAFKEVTTATSSLISRVVTVPLLIRLVNLKLPYLVQSVASTLVPITDTTISFEFRGSMDSVDISRFILSSDGIVGDSTVLLSGFSVKPISESQTSLTSSVYSNGNLWYSYTDTGLVTGTTYCYTITPHLSTLSVTTGYPYTYEYTTL